MIMRKMELQESKIEMKNGGRNINNLHYADDPTLLFETKEELKHLTKRFKDENVRFGFFLNIKKTKLVITLRNDRKVIEYV